MAEKNCWCYEPAGSSSRGMRRLLVVEDNAVIRDMLCCVFSKRHFEVMSASNGAEALELAAVHNLDAILTDDEMPVVDGLEVCRCVRKQSAVAGRVVPVWIMSRSNDSNLVLQAFSAGAISVLKKPGRIADLCKRFEQQLKFIERTRLHGRLEPTPPNERQRKEDSTARRKATLKPARH